MRASNSPPSLEADRPAAEPASGPVACIIVTFHPDTDVLSRALRALPKQAAVVIVDNASGPNITNQLIDLLSAHGRKDIVLNDRNVGLAAAVNHGVSRVRALWPDIRFVLLLDQDSEPTPGSVHTLIEAHDELTNSGEPVGCVGPLLVDTRTGLQHGFHQCTQWRWVRTYPTLDSAEPIPCINLNGSGTLVSADLFLDLGGLDESLFIDHVDTEWIFRLSAAGYRAFGIPQSIFHHRMGEGTRRFWFFGWKVWPLRSPTRHYFLFRNAATLMQRTYVPRIWKFWGIVKLLLTFLTQLVLGPQRLQHVRCMSEGLRDGWTTRNSCRK